MRKLKADDGEKQSPKAGWNRAKSASRLGIESPEFTARGEGKHLAGIAAARVTSMSIFLKPPR